MNSLERSLRMVTSPDVTPATKDPRSTPKWAPELPWLQPYPDEMLEPAAPREAEPDAVVAARETMQLVYLAAIQHLPPRQRAVLILRDALDWSAKETAGLLDMTLPAVNSALQRARTTMRGALPRDAMTDAAVAQPTRRGEALLQKIKEAFARADAAALTSLLPADARLP